MATTVTPDTKQSGYNQIARVLVLDGSTNAALERLLRKTLENATYLDATLSSADIHLLKRLGVTVLGKNEGVQEPLAEWEEILLSGADEQEISYTY